MLTTSSGFDLMVMIDEQFDEQIRKLAGVGRMQEAADVALRIFQPLVHHPLSTHDGDRAAQCRLLDDRAGRVEAGAVVEFQRVLPGFWRW
jgi:hypothetical protein